jgi:hypothetical protein
MQLGRNDKGLREALDRITKRPRADQPDLLATLAQTHAHDIRLIKFGDQASPYTCIQHALGLEDPPNTVRRIANLYPDDRLYLSPEFVGYLVDHKLTETSLDEVTSGDVLIYWITNNVVKHLGLVEGPRVLSKWGNGNLWNHAPLEVPQDYGDMVRAYRPIPVEDAIDAFFSYARTVAEPRLVDSIVGAG